MKLLYFNGLSGLHRRNVGESIPEVYFLPSLIAGGIAFILSSILGILLQKRLNISSPMVQMLLGLLPMQFFAFGAAAIPLAMIGIAKGDVQGILGNLNIEFRTTFKEIFQTLLIIYPLFSIIIALSTLFCRLLHIPVVEQVIVTMLRENGTFSLKCLVWISGVIVAPVVEEFLFRVVLFHSMRVFFPVVAPYGTALLFAFLHGSPQLVPALTLFSLVLQVTCSERGLLHAIFLHSFFNAISLGLFFFLG